MANNLGQVQPVAATATVKKNQIAQQTRSGAVIPFYAYFSNGKNTVAPPAKWLTRK